MYRIRVVYYIGRLPVSPFFLFRSRFIDGLKMHNTIYTGYVRNVNMYVRAAIASALKISRKSIKKLRPFDGNLNYFLLYESPAVFNSRRPSPRSSSTITYNVPIRRNKQNMTIMR